MHDDAIGGAEEPAGVEKFVVIIKILINAPKLELAQKVINKNREKLIAVSVEQARALETPVFANRSLNFPDNRLETREIARGDCGAEILAMAANKTQSEIEISSERVVEEKPIAREAVKIGLDDGAILDNCVRYVRIMPIKSSSV